MDGITVSECKEFLNGLTKEEHEMSASQIVTCENMLIDTISDSKTCFEVLLAEQVEIMTTEEVDLNAFDGDSIGHKPEANDKSLLFTAIRQTIEQLDLTQESVITFIVPDEFSEDQPLVTNQFIFDDVQFANEENVDVENSFFEEHSYCNFWDLPSESEHSYCKFAKSALLNHSKLQSRVALVGAQEKLMLSRMRSLETIITQLRLENVLSDEKN
ncbi:LOW QUALITY PROTEIN: THAP domain-containing protein 5 [Pyxicephalus adspersus]|uniref:LOW QUALITY PROTEIN: THAP domain-containing protein 5 n=1 Tax=Pyxicephalus adspersus TaxID=30357 RepID=UPI003B5BC12F